MRAIDSRVTSSVAIVIAAFLWVGPASAQDEGGPTGRERFTARAMVMGTSNPPVIPIGASATLDINITRWTSDEERAALLQTLAEHGQEGLYKALSSQEETGWISATGPGRDGGLKRFPRESLRYARQFVNEDGSRRLVLALDRQIGFYEAAYQPRWRDYDVTLCVLDLDADGNGTGQLAVGVQLELDTTTKTLKIENFGTEPVRLLNVRQQR